MRWRTILLGVFLCLELAACAGKRGTGSPSSIYGPGPGRGYQVGKPYQVNGVWYVPTENPNYDQIGIASWYGREFQGRPTANGETYQRGRLTAAHTTLPLPVIVRVTNLENGQSTLLRINDRGPFVSGRIIDVSEAAAKSLGFRESGLARVRVQYAGRADGGPIAPTAQPAPVASISPRAAPNPAPSVTTALEGAENALRGLEGGYAQPSPDVTGSTTPP